MPIRAVPLQGDVSWVVVRTLSTAFLRSSRSRAARLLRRRDCISSAPVGFTFDDQNANEDFIRLVMVEHPQRRPSGEIAGIQELNASVIKAVMMRMVRSRHHHEL
ncbi:MAG: hypothetical protein ACJ8C7_19110 [Microvirga sp.]